MTIVGGMPWRRNIDHEDGHCDYANQWSQFAPHFSWSRMGPPQRHLKPSLGHPFASKLKNLMLRLEIVLVELAPVTKLVALIDDVYDAVSDADCR